MGPRDVSPAGIHLAASRDVWRELFFGEEVGEQHVCDQAALAHPSHAAGRGVVAPQRADDALPSLAVRSRVEQPRRRSRPRTDHGQPLGDKSGELLEHRQRHRPARGGGQDEIAVRLPVGQRGQPVAAGEPREDHLGVDSVELIARGQRGPHVSATGNELGRVLPEEVAAVGHASPLAEQELAAADVVEKGVAPLPPGHVGVDGVEREQARSGVDVGLMRPEVDHGGVHAVGKLRVEFGLPGGGRMPRAVGDRE